MTEGYESGRFEKPVDENLHCVICTEVLNDPVQCRRNEHHFCRKCITRHLQHSRNCPTCQDPLSVDTLVRPQRFLANTLSGLKISCDNSERGCFEVVELGSLNTHVASCGFTPVPCSNHPCEEIISRRDKEIHENKVCGFRRVKCDYCGQVVQHMNFMQHTCPARKEMGEMKADMAGMKAEMTETKADMTQTKAEMAQTKDDMAENKAELKNVSSKQDEMFKTMQNMMSNLMRIERNTAQRSEASCASSAQNLQAEIIIAGRWKSKSAEVFNMAKKTWRPLSEMNERRAGASSVLYQGRMMVTGGGTSAQYLDSVEELNLTQQHEHWVQSQVKLPAPSYSHACAVHDNKLFVIGGRTLTQVSNSIHEIQLTPPHTSRLLTNMPQPVCYHGAEIVNDKVYIIGGTTTGDATDTVLVFDPATNTCIKIRPLPYPVSEMATVTWKDNVIVLGGRDNERNTLNKVTMYNTTTGSHRMLPEMRKKRHGCTAVIIADNIIVMGGFEPETFSDLNSVECYNFDTNTWTEFPAMAEAKAYATAVVRYY